MVAQWTIFIVNEEEKLVIQWVLVRGKGERIKKKGTLVSDQRAVC